MALARSLVNCLSLSRIALGCLFVICFQRNVSLLYISISACVAALITDILDGFLAPLLSWSLLVREIALYITRVLYIEKLPKIEQIRPWTNWHGYFMYLTIILGLFRMSADVHGRMLLMHPYIQVSAFAALVFGVGSIVSFLKL